MMIKRTRSAFFAAVMILALLMHGCTISFRPGGSGSSLGSSTSIAETVVYDANGIKITVLGFGGHGIFGPEIDILVENSTSRNIVLCGYDYIVNGITMEGTAYINVAANTKAKGTISLIDSELDVAGVTTIATISAKHFSILDASSLKELYDLAFDIRTDVADSHTQSMPTHSAPIFSRDGVTVSVCGTSETQMFRSVVLAVSNSSGKDIFVASDNESANGYSVTADLFDTVYAGTVRYCGIDYQKKHLENSGISTITHAAFTLDISTRQSSTYITKGEKFEVSFDAP